MILGPAKKTGGVFLVIAMVGILVLGGILGACSRAQTSTSTQATTSTSARLTTTTSAPASTTTSALPTATTSAPTTTTTSAPVPTGVSAASFYKANVVSVVVPYVAGGGVDYAARLFANYWMQVTGGRMVVENKDGAGGLVGANSVYTAKPDGLTMGVGIPGAGLMTPVLLQDPSVKYDLKKMNWVIYTNREGLSSTLGISAKLPYTSMQELQKVSGLKFAGTGRYEGGAMAAGLIIELFGLKDTRIVVGYGGTGEVMLALGKGEVDAYITSGSSNQDGIDKGFTKKPLATLEPKGTPYFPDVPTVRSLLKLSPEQENYLLTFEALSTGQAFWLPPGVPQDRIDFVRSAFDQIATLDGFLKGSTSRWKYQPPISGKDYAGEMEKTLAVVTPQKFNELKLLVDKYAR